LNHEDWNEIYAESGTTGYLRRVVVQPDVVWPVTGGHRLDFAKQAKAEGMRAIVLKNHYAPTVRVAYLVGPTRRSFLGLD